MQDVIPSTFNSKQHFNKGALGLKSSEEPPMPLLHNVKGGGYDIIPGSSHLISLASITAKKIIYFENLPLLYEKTKASEMSQFARMLSVGSLYSPWSERR